MSLDPREPTDATLLQRMRCGDLSAFQEVVRRYQSRVRNTVRRTRISPADVDDLVQEAFMAAYQSMDRLQEPDRLGAWLNAVARRICSNWQRRNDKRLSAAATEAVSGTTLACPRQRPDEQLQQNEIRESIRAAIAALPPPTSTAVSLYYLDGYTYHDIAMVLSIPVTTVKGRLQMGRERLRKVLVALMETDNQVMELLKQAHEEHRKSHLAHSPRALEIVEQALTCAEHLPTRRERDLARAHALRHKARFRRLLRGDTLEAQLRLEALKLARKHREHGLVGTADGPHPLPHRSLCRGPALPGQGAG